MSNLVQSSNTQLREEREFSELKAEKRNSIKLENNKDIPMSLDDIN